MKTRIITGIMGALAIIGILMAGEIALNITVIAVMLICLYELMNSVKLNEVKPLYYGNFVFSLLIFLSGVFFKEHFNLIFLIYVFYNLFVMVFTNGQTRVESVGKSIFSVLYVTLLLMHLALVRNNDLGLFNVILVLLGAVATDTFAYFVGVTIGKHKLCPKMSPKKTIEGALGGILGTLVVFIIYGLIAKNAFDINVNFIGLSILALLSAIFSEVGDLCASVVKRQFDIKDFGNVLPGHGGIMDRVDSICFVAPVVYYFISFIPVFIK